MFLYVFVNTKQMRKTNVDIAKEVVEENDKYFHHDEHEASLGAAMCMAKAKDEQWMKAVVKWLRENHVKYPNPDISNKSLISNFKAEIKELIK